MSFNLNEPYKKESYKEDYQESLRPEFFVELSKILKWENNFSKLNEQKEIGSKKWFLDGKINYLSQIDKKSSLVIYSKRGRGEYSAEKLINETKKVMGFISTKKINKNDRVLICAEDKYYSILIALACMGLGIKFGFIYYNLPTEMINKYLEIINPELLFYESKARLNYEPVNREFIEVEEILESSYGLVEPGAFPATEPTCFLINSGTSNTPKVTYSGLIGTFLMGSLFNRKFLYKENTAFWMPLDFAWGPSFVFFIYPALISGNKIILTPTFFKPENDFCKNENISSVVLNPISHEILIPNPEQLESIMFLGEKMSLTARESFFRKLGNSNTKVYDGYGQNEANSIILFSEIKNEEGFKPFYGVKCKISHEGELLLENNLPSLVPGFIHNGNYADLWDNENNYLKTGDLARLGDKGNFFLYGRKDCSVKVKGRYVNLLEIEKYIENTFNIETKIIYDKKNNTLVLFLLNNIINNEEILKTIEKKYGKYILPSKIIKLERFPMNQAGKISLIELEAMI